MKCPAALAQATNTVSWALLLVSLPAVVRSAEVPKRVTWGEFCSTVNEKTTIRMALPDGAIVEGRVLRTRPDGLDVHVTRTSNPQAHPKGDASISRALLSTVEIRRPHRKGKLIGTLVPLGVGSALAAGGMADKAIRCMDTYWLEG